MELWRQERETEEIIGISESFYGVMREHLKMWKSKVNDTLDPFIKKLLLTHLKRLRYVIWDIIEIRTRKIIEKVLRGEQISVSITREEYTFYERLEQIYKLYKKEIFSPKEVVYVTMNDILGTEKTENLEETIEYVVVRFLKDIKEPITGLDGKYYGPFKKDDICVIPKENAKGLVQHEIATSIGAQQPKGE